MAANRKLSHQLLFYRNSLQNLFFSLASRSLSERKEQQNISRTRNSLLMEVVWTACQGRHGACCISPETLRFPKTSEAVCECAVQSTAVHTYVELLQIYRCV